MKGEYTILELLNQIEYHSLNSPLAKVERDKWINECIKELKNRLYPKIQISANRWFDKTYGNTYHSVNVYIDMDGKGFKHIGRVPFAYGYDRAYLQTALKILQDFGIREKTGDRLKSGGDKDYYDFLADIRENKDRYDIHVTDVNRKKDL